MNVYVIGADERGPHKIGISRDPAARLLSLQSGAPSLRIVQTWPREDARKIEAVAHKLLADKRAGREWFNVAAQDACAAVDAAIANPILKPARKAKPVRQPEPPRKSLNDLWREGVAEVGEVAMVEMVDTFGRQVAEWRAENDRKGLPAWP